MCWSLLRNKFFWIGLAIYLLPGFIFLGWGFANTPRPSTGKSWEWSDLVIVFANPIGFAVLIGLLFAVPIIFVGLIGYLLPASVVMVVYLSGAYGLLYLWIRKTYKRKRGEV